MVRPYKGVSVIFQKGRGTLGLHGTLAKIVDTKQKKQNAERL